MKEKDYHILQWLAEQDEPVEFKENTVPLNVRINYTFYGLDRNNTPNSIYIALFDLEQLGLVKKKHIKYSITDYGRRAVESYLNGVAKVEEKDNLEFENMRIELQKAHLEIADLVNKLADYDKVKRQAKWSAFFSALSAIAAIVTILISLRNGK
jgi:DNA-binding PadR family transcriptional regulator